MGETEDTPPNSQSNKADDFDVSSDADQDIRKPRSKPADDSPSKDSADEESKSDTESVTEETAKQKDTKEPKPTAHEAARIIFKKTSPTTTHQPPTKHPSILHQRHSPKTVHTDEKNLSDTDDKSDNKELSDTAENSDTSNTETADLAENETNDQDKKGSLSGDSVDDKKHPKSTKDDNSSTDQQVSERSADGATQPVADSRDDDESGSSKSTLAESEHVKPPTSDQGSGDETDTPSMPSDDASTEIVPDDQAPNHQELMNQDLKAEDIVEDSTAPEDQAAGPKDKTPKIDTSVIDDSEPVVRQPVAGRLHGGYTQMVLVILAFILAVVAGTLGAYRWYQDRNPSPVDVFNAMLENNLDTTTVVQNYRADTGLVAIAVRGENDFRNISAPKISATMDTDVQLTFRLSIRADLIIIDDDVYLRYTKVDSIDPDDPSQVTSADESVLDKWVFLIRNGEAVGGDDLQIAGLGNSLNTVLGHVLIGDFSDQQDQQILEFITDNNVYSYDPENVLSDVVGDTNAYRYDVTIDSQKLAELMELVAGMTGEDQNQTKLQAKLKEIKSAKQAVMWVAKSSKRLLKLELDVNGAKTTFEYEGFNEPLEIQIPVATMTLEQLQQQTPALFN